MAYQAASFHRLVAVQKLLSPKVATKPSGTG